MSGFDTTVLVNALEDTKVFSEDQIELFEAGADGLQAMGPEDFEKLGLSLAEVALAVVTVRRAVESYGVSEERQSVIPERPPYLADTGNVTKYGKPLDDETRTVKVKADVGDYDAHDQTQFFTVGDQMFRWDGKRSEQYPDGKRHEITIVEHTVKDGIYVPDPKQVAAAKAANLEWFHKGYGCWITADGKPYAAVSRKTLTAVRAVTPSGVPQRVA
jgi:hypothetical protein